MLQSLSSPQHAAKWCQQQRARDKTIGYIPTMGALHQGHLSLVARAVRDNDLACVSIFVNPLQFNEAHDLKNYPRTAANDLALLQQVNCDMVYGGTLAQFFPEVADINTLPTQASRTTSPADSSPAMHGLEGEFRPGYLQGVGAIVERLFNTVGPCTAYFGEKDFQQTLIIKHLAKSYPDIQVVVCPTIREPCGLAMSSRNAQLSIAQRHLAVKLYQALCAAKQAWRSGVRNTDELERLMHHQLQHALIRIEYATVRDPANWHQTPPINPYPDYAKARALVAAFVGEVRLIDNMALS